MLLRRGPAEPPFPATVNHGVDGNRRDRTSFQMRLFSAIQALLLGIPRLQLVFDKPCANLAGMVLLFSCQWVSGEAMALFMRLEFRLADALEVRLSSRSRLSFLGAICGE